MAASLKEKNMPTISSNIYGGLQKWVSRASVSLKGRRNRTNSIVSAMSSYPRNNFGSLTKETGTQAFTPSHSRSRSNPVTMSDTLTFEAEYEKIPQVAKQTKNAGRIRKTSLELSDDSSSRGSLTEIKELTVSNRRLSNALSKSESNLIEKHKRSKSLNGASRKLHRKISQGTATSVDSNSSELDINDAHKKSQSSQSLHKTNKRDKSNSVDLARINKSEHISSISSSSKSIEEMSKNIHARLDTWVEKTTGFQQNSQNSFDSTSSSDDTFDNNNKLRQKDTKYFRDLQSALDELVSSCGRTSARNSIIVDNDNNNNNKTKRKPSLQNSGAVFNRSVDIEYNSSQEQRHNVYKNEKCGSSSDSASSRGKDQQTKIEKKEEEICHEEQHNELECSYDSVDGLIDERDEPHKNYSSEGDTDIGPTIPNTRGMNTDHAPNEPQNTSTTKNINLPDLTITNGHISDEGSSCCTGPNSIDSPVNTGETKFNFENGSVLPRPKKSPKKRHAPSPPSNSGTEKTSIKATATVFDDDELTEFAQQCIEASERSKRKPNSLEREDERNRSDSDEEKTAVSLDYVYIPKNIKSTSYLKTNYDQKVPLQGAFSDDECYSRNPIRYNQAKRNSEDSLDGLVILSTSRDIDIDKDSDDKFHSSNELEQENENTKHNNKTDYGIGLRKFPSMPLFYVPNDGSRKSSRGKSLWRKLKSLPRATDKDSTRTSAAHKNKATHMQLNSNRTDPFYHGERDQESNPAIRPKSHSMAISTKNGTALRRRLSLEATEQSTSLPAAFPVKPPLENDTERAADNATVVSASTEPAQDESQC